MRIMNAKWSALLICVALLGITSSQHVHASQQSHRTSIIRVSMYKHHKVSYKGIKLYKSHHAKIHHINKIKKYIKKQYHYKSVKHKRMPRIRHISYKRKEVLNRFKMYNFKYHYDVITAEPVREYYNIHDTSPIVIPKGKILKVRSAIYQHHKVVPFGFKLSNGSFIPSYAVAYVFG